MSKHSVSAGHSYPLYCFLILIYMSYPIQCNVSKCCPTDSVIKTSNELSCESISNRTVAWDAHNVLPSSIPNCSTVHNVFNKNETSVGLNGCLDRNTNNQFVAVSCSTDPDTSVHLMNKCCPTGLSYDHSERQCKQNLNSNEHFKSLFGDSAVVFKNEVPNCAEAEVFVEYFSTIHSIRFEGMLLKVDDETFLSEKFCIDDLVNINSVKASEQHVIVRICRPRSVCDKIPCMRRCCKVDQIIEPQPEGNKVCQFHPSKINLLPIFHNVSLPLKSPEQAYPKDYGMLESWRCKQVFMLNQNIPDDRYYLSVNGMLYLDEQEPLSPEKYCIENVLTPNGSTIVSAFLCFDDENYQQLAKHDYYPYGLLISCVFLAITLAVYLSIPKLLNLHGKTLVCYVTSFLAVYITLAILQFNQQDRTGFCYEVAFFLLYCLIAAFCWQTAMCFDIWLTFGSLRSSFVMRHNRRNQRKFLYYSAYAWGVPLAWTVFTLYAEKYKFLANNWNPSIGEVTCFFDRSVNWRNHFLFFLLPAGLHVLVNCILFVITAIRCSRVKNEIHRMQCRVDDSSTSAKRRKFIVSRAMFVFIINLKLFTVMGISWILEIISTFSTNETVEAILDTYNLLIGVFIFFIFVFKRKVLYELKCRFGFEVKNTGTGTPRSTTITHTGNISMKDMTCTSDKSLPLLNSSSTTLQIPAPRK